MKKSVAATILAAMIIGAVANALVTWKTVDINAVRIDNIEKENISIKTKIDDIHWYLIESQNVKVKRNKHGN